MKLYVPVALLGLFFCAPTVAQESELEPAALERLGKLSGEVLLHGGVLRRLDIRCPGGRGGAAAVDSAAELERDAQALPDNFQSAFILQSGAALKVGDLVARDLVSKAGGCATEAFRKAYAQAEDEHRKALQSWRQRGR